MTAEATLARLAVYAPILDRLDAGALAPIVRRALRRPGAVPTAWRWEAVTYAAYLPRRLLVKIEGAADVRGVSVPWSAVIKILEPPAATEQGGHAGASAWDREARAYRCGLLARLPGGLAAPRVLQIGPMDSDPTGAVWLWLEHVQDAFGGRWPLVHFGIAAGHLGRFNGAYFVSRPLPRYRWLSQWWAESHSEPALLPDARREVDLLLAHPDVRAVFPAPVADRMRRLLDDQPFFLDVLARLPNTLCHHDASSANLFARRRATFDDAKDAPDESASGIAGSTQGAGSTRDEGAALGEGATRDERASWETVAIDWEDMGPGPAGAEAATLVFGTMRRGAFPAQRASELERTVLEQYERGLRQAGWRGDSEVVRLGYTAAVALRWYLVPATLRLLVDPVARERAARTAQQSAETILRQRIPLVHFLLECADEARRLARSS